MDSQTIQDSLELAKPILDIYDTLVVRTDGVIEVKNITQPEGMDYKLLVAFITTAISLFSICFIIWDRLKNPKLSGKLLSLTFSKEGSFHVKDLHGQDINIHGVRYCLKLSINVINKHLFYSDVKIKVRYPMDKKEYEGRQYFTNNDKWTFNKETKTLKLPDDKFIAFNNVLEKDKTLFLYSTFIVEREYEVFKEMRFEFISPKGKSYILGPLNSSDFKAELAFFEKEIWQ